MRNEPESTGESRANKGTLFIGFCVFFAVVSVWSLSWFLIDKFVLSSNLTLATNEAARGVFGDKFGAVNALFSGLAFTGLIWTLILQRQDLALQRQEIEAQNITLNRQRFETTMFQLLGLHSSIVEKLVVKSYTGREAFAFFIESMKSSVIEFRIFHALKKLAPQERYELHTNRTLAESALPKLDGNEQKSLISDAAAGLNVIKKFESTDDSYHASIINSAYSKAHEQSRDGLSHYFRNLYHIFKYIDDASIDAVEKNRYARIVRAQLSDDELLSIFYNCVAIMDEEAKLELGYPKMTYFAKKYNLFNNLNPYSLIHERHLIIAESRYEASIQYMKKNGVVHEDT